ncbi:MAG TPA: 6-phosphogluconolactonase, partial [Gemmatimonadales bacterium]
MLLIAETPGEVWERAAAWLADAVRETVMTRGRCTLALSGGTTPREVYHRLSALPVPWNDVEIFFGDERAVPPGSPESNYHMAEESLLARIPVSRLRVHRMEAERSDLGEVAAEYERLLPEALDILILGIGADGHTASLFPHAPALHERERLVMPVVGGEPLIQRLTITPPVIERA